MIANSANDAVKHNSFKIFTNKRILVTGHTGFKGSWLTTWLKLLGAEIIGISLDPVTNPSNFIASKVYEGITDLRIDLRDLKSVKDIISEFQPDFVFHLAAQAIVSESYLDPVKTWETNVIGTINLLEGIRQLKHPTVAILVTSDKCYRNFEWVWGYRENDELGGDDPYSASKAATELAINSYVKSYFSRGDNSTLRIATARAGNVIGGGDWSVNRIIPDCIIRSVNGEKVLIRNPSSIRPWQHVLEPLSGYLSLAVEMRKGKVNNGESFNFGPCDNKHFSVLQLVKELKTNWNKINWEKSNLESANYSETNFLKLNCEKAMQEIKWQSTLDFEQTVSFTAEWYKTYYNNASMSQNMTITQLLNFCEIAKEKGIAWAQTS